MDKKNNNLISENLKYAQKNEESELDSHARASQSRISELRILVVDDDTVMQEIITTIISGLGVTSFEQASNGVKALECLENSNNQSFDVIVCDLEMPEMDGIELLRHLAERNYIGGIILMSGRDPRVLNSVSQLVHRHNLELLGVLVKPFEATDLANLLKEYTEIIQSEASSKQELV